MTIAVMAESARSTVPLPRHQVCSGEAIQRQVRQRVVLQLLVELGRTDAEVDQLLADGVIGEPDLF